MAEIFINIYNLATKNILRRKGKMALLVVGLSVGIAALAAIFTLILAFQKGIETKLEALGYDIVVYPSSSNLSLSYGGITLSGVDTFETPALNKYDIEKVRRIVGNNVLAVSPKLLYSIGISGEQVLFVGTDIIQEMRIKSWWKLNGKWIDDPKNLVVGFDVARSLRLKKGDALKIGRNVFRVASILPDTGSQDDGIVFVDIEALRQAVGKKDEASVIELASNRNAEVGEVIKKIQGVLPKASAVSIKQAVEQKEKATNSLADFGMTIAIIIVVISGFMVFLTMSSSVSERSREIGILRAIGFRRSLIARIVLMEALFLSVLAGLTGYAVGFIAAFLLPYVVGSTELTVQINVFVLFASIGLAVIVGLTASLPAIWKATAIDPVDALKSI